MRKYLIPLLVSAVIGIATGQTTEKWQQLARGMSEQQVIQLVGKPIATKQSQRGKIAFYQQRETTKGCIKYRKRSTVGRGNCMVTSWVEPDWAKMPKPKPKPAGAPPKPMRANQQAKSAAGSARTKTSGTDIIGVWADLERWKQLEKGMTIQQVTKLLGFTHNYRGSTNNLIYIYGDSFDLVKGIVVFRKPEGQEGHDVYSSHDAYSVYAWTAPVEKPRIKPEICITRPEQWQKMNTRKRRTEEEILEIFGKPLKIKEVGSSNGPKYGPHESKKFYYYQGSADRGYVAFYKDPVKTDGKWVAYPGSWRPPEYWRDPEQWKKLKVHMRENQVDEILGYKSGNIGERYKLKRVYARGRIRGYVKFRGIDGNQQVLFFVESWTEPDWADSEEYNKVDSIRQQEKEKLRLKNEKLRLEKLQERKKRAETHRIIRQRLRSMEK